MQASYMISNINYKIRYVNDADKDFWFSLDKHLSVAQFEKKVRDRQGYILSVDDTPIAILRYNLFWDNTPFCTMLYVSQSYQNQGYGTALMYYWENEMQSLGYDLLLVSTRADETSQYFYRKIDYIDCGALDIANEATELILYKRINN